MDSNNGVLLNLNKLRQLNKSRSKSTYRNARKTASVDNKDDPFNTLGGGILNKKNNDVARRQRRETTKRMVMQAIYTVDKDADMQRGRASTHHNRKER